MAPRFVLAIGCLGRCLAPSFFAVCTFVSPPSAWAQTPEDAAVAQVRASVTQRALWGREFPLLIASIPGWARIEEKIIIVAADVMIGGTPFKTREEAERQSQALISAIAETRPTLRANFARAAEEARSATAAKVAVRRYGGDESYRVVVGPGVELLPPDLRLADVQRVLGKEQSVRRDVEDAGGERRPSVFTGYVYGGGGIVYQTSNYAPAPDQVVRVVLNVPFALRAIAE